MSAQERLMLLEQGKLMKQKKIDELEKIRLEREEQQREQEARQKVIDE